MLYFAGKCYMNPTMCHKDTFVGKASSQTDNWLEVKPKSHSTVSCVTYEWGAAMNLEVMQLYISQWFTDSTLGSMLIKMWVSYFSCPLSVCYWWAPNCIRVYNRVELHLPLVSAKINHFQSCADKLWPLPSLNQPHLTTSKDWNGTEYTLPVQLYASAYSYASQSERSCFEMHGRRAVVEVSQTFTRPIFPACFLKTWWTQLVAKHRWPLDFCVTCSRERSALSGVLHLLPQPSSKCIWIEETAPLLTPLLSAFCNLNV